LGSFCQIAAFGFVLPDRKIVDGLTGNIGLLPPL
jgi:hypothetical protein